MGLLVALRRLNIALSSVKIEDDTVLAMLLLLREWWHFVPHNTEAKSMTCQYFSSNSSNEISSGVVPFCLSSMT